MFVFLYFFFMFHLFFIVFFFFFNDTATTEIYTLSLHDALPILLSRQRRRPAALRTARHSRLARAADTAVGRYRHSRQPDAAAPPDRRSPAARSRSPDGSRRSRDLPRTR